LISNKTDLQKPFRPATTIVKSRQKSSKVVKNWRNLLKFDLKRSTDISRQNAPQTNLTHTGKRVRPQRSTMKKSFVCIYPLEGPNQRNIIIFHVRVVHHPGVSNNRSGGGTSGGEQWVGSS
jgi:hypothetical protein